MAIEFNPMRSLIFVHCAKEKYRHKLMHWQYYHHVQESIAQFGPYVSQYNYHGDVGRSSGRDGVEGTIPFVWAFVPMWWEEEFKGAGRTLEDGCNYRWLFTIKYPKGVPQEEGDRWFFEDMIPAFAEMPHTTKIVTSKIKQEINGCPFHRLVEMWFDDNEVWHDAVMNEAQKIRKPEWASVEQFPYLKPQTEIVGEFLSDRPADMHYSQFRGYIPMR